MAQATPIVTRIQDQHDAPALGVGQNGMALTWDNATGAFVATALVADHGGLTGLADDDHTGYALLAGRAGGQTLYGGTAANDDLVLHGTSDATRTTSYVLLQPTAGNVGIGTTAPATMLHAVSTTATTNALRNVLTLGSNVTDTGVGDVNLGAAVLFQGESSTTADQDQAKIGALWTTATHATRASALTFSTLTAGGSLTERMRIDGAGNVGIGTDTPSSLLHIAKNANSSLQIKISNETDGTLALTRLLFGDGSADTDLFFTSYNTGFVGNGLLGVAGEKLAEFAANTNASAMVVGTRGAKAFYVSTNATPRLIINSTGLVGINDTAPAEALDVTGNINTTGVYKVDDVQVLSNRVIDARCADVANSGDATTDGLIDALRDAMILHGLIAAAA